MISRRVFYPVFLGFLFLASILIQKDYFARIISSPEIAKASVFFNAMWDMTPDELMRADNLILSAPTLSKKLYQAQPGSENKYQTFEANTRKFLGRPAIVQYTFFENRLSMLHVFVEDSDGERLDKEMRGYLIRTYGNSYSAIEDQTPLKMIWQSSDYKVNYWFYEESLSLRAKYKAIFGITKAKN